MKKLLFYTTSNVASVVQYGGIGALEGSQVCVEAFRQELQLRRDFFYGRLAKSTGGVLTGVLPKGAFYAFLRIDPAWTPGPDAPASRSWALAEHLITRGRIGCVPGADFGATGEGYIRFCFARDRRELGGALDSMRQVLAEASQESESRI
jgi:aspartate/methionine/tyrosine aminotransferase